MKMRKSPTWLDQTIGWGLIFLLGSLPLVIYTSIFEHISPKITNFAVLDSGMVFDIFVTGKYYWLVAGGGLIILLFAYKTTLPGFQLQSSPLHLPLLVLTAAVLLSLAFANFKSIAVAGLPKYNRMGTLTYLIDIGLCVVALHTPYIRKLKYGLLYALAPFVVINAVLVSVWFLGMDTLAVPAIRDLFYTPGITLTAKGKLITTLGNQNYSSGFGAVLAVLYLSAAMLLGEIRHQVACLALALLSFLTMVTSLAASGYMALYAAGPVLAMVAWRRGSLRQVVRTGLYGVAGFAVIFLVAQAYQPQVLLEAKAPFQEVAGLFAPRAAAGGEAGAEPGGPGAPGAAGSQPGGFQLPEVPESLRSGGSGRVHIWRNTLRLLRERPLVGHGLDTIAYTFPQNDPGGGNLEVTVKPHNIFLDYGYGAGVVAMLAFLAVLLITLWRVAWHPGDDPANRAIVVALGLGLVAFMVQGLVNDLVLGTSTALWVVVGCVGALSARGAEGVMQSHRESKRRAVRSDQRTL